MGMARRFPVTWDFKPDGYTIKVPRIMLPAAQEVLQVNGLLPIESMFASAHDAAMYHSFDLPEGTPEPDLSDPEMLENVKRYEAETRGTIFNPTDSVPLDGLDEVNEISGDLRALSIDKLMEIAEFEAHYGEIPKDGGYPKIVSWKRRDTLHKVWRPQGFTFYCQGPSDSSPHELSLAGVVMWLCQEKLLLDNGHALDDASVLQQCGFKIDTERSESNEDNTEGQIVWTKKAVEVTKFLGAKYVYYEYNDPKAKFPIYASNFQTIKNRLVHDNHMKGSR